MGMDEGLSVAPRVFEIKEGQTNAVTIGDEAGTRVHGTVSGAPVSNETYVVISKPDTGAVQAPTAEDPLDYLAHLAGMGSGMVRATVGKDGTFEVAGLDPGEYDIRVFSEDVSAITENIQNLANDPSALEVPKPLVTQHITVGTEPLQLEFALPEPQKE